MKYLRHISLFLFALSSVLLLCTVFACDNSLADGMVMGKVHWFHLTMLFFAGSSLLWWGTGRKKELFKWNVADGLVLLLAALVVVRYDWALDPEPEKLLFAGQLVVLWILLRIALSVGEQWKVFFLTVIVLTGLAEAVWGIRQLHGWSYSNHSLYRLTGSFYNPGPYSGYLAAVLPVSLWMILRFKGLLHYVGWISLLAIIVVLPAGMSRTAWIAAVVACGWVYWLQQAGWKQTKDFIKGHRALTIIFSVLIIIILTGALAGSYLLKKDSANGRFLMWKVTVRAIAEHPAGTGLGGFPAAFAEAQAGYFTSGSGTETEMLVAGCPEYAFNEFLQIGLEEGVAGLIVFVLLVGYSLYRGVKNKQEGAAAGILALAIFASGSYPLQLPEFWVLLMLLMGVACTSSGEVREGKLPLGKGKTYAVFALMAVAAAGCCVLFAQQKKWYGAYKKWNTLKVLYNSKAYEAASDGYGEQLNWLDHQPEFLFEAAQCLSKTGKYQEANALLKRAMLLSADPMIHYMAARNEQAQGNYQQAEARLLHAIDILPERIYPYYLLAKLYAEPAFYRKDKLRDAADKVLSKTPKVESTAIKEMRMEVKKILDAEN